VTDAENLIRQGIEVYPCDDASSDATISIAESYLGRGVIGIERLPHGAVYRWRRILERKEELCAALDADESHLPPPGHATLGEAFAEVERRGYDAAHCFEFTFIPTRESPDHDHRRFRSTLHSYYPFLPTFSALCAGMEATRRADGARPLRAAHRALARRAGRACVAR